MGMVISKADAAKIQLEAAIDAYQVGNDLVSIVLASACEEILGKLCEREGISHSLEDLVRIGKENGIAKDDKELRGFLNTTKNSSKHYSSDAESHIEVDDLDAYFLLCRACINYLRLNFPDRIPIEKFFAASLGF